MKESTTKASASTRKTTKTPLAKEVAQPIAVAKKSKPKALVAPAPAPAPAPVAGPEPTKKPAKTKATAPQAPVVEPVAAPFAVAVVKPAKEKPAKEKPVKEKPGHTSGPALPPAQPVLAKAKIASKPAAAAESVSPVKPAPSEADLSLTGMPVRSTRPSSRLAQLTVPSIAQTVASTAAKASFSQMTPVAPIASPLPSAVKKDSKLANNWKKKSVTELTDAEVLAMADSDYMNDTQLAFFRLKLVVLKNSMLSNAGETTEHLREDTVVVPDPADRATIEEEHALELRTRDRERKLLKKIEQSIARIDSGDYGYCDETGEPIGVGRLLARPTASLSLEAQQRRELKQKMFGD